MSQTSQMTIAELNDRFRQHNLGHGKIVLTQMVSMMSIEQRASIIKMVKNFNNFSEENDLHGEHDYGRIEFEGEEYLWKIDYFDVSYEYGSEDPANSDVTRRVMTIMHWSEY